MNKKQKKQKTPIYTSVPVYILAAFVAALPLMALPISIELSEAELFVIPNSGGVYVDAYLRFREILLFVTGAGLLLFLLGERIFPDHPLPSPLSEKSARLPLVCCGAYLLFAVVSALFSEYGGTSFWGSASESEGVAAVFGYAALFLAALNYARGEKKRLLMYSALAAACVVSLLFVVERVSSATVGELFFGFRDDRAGISLLFGNPAACGEFCVLLFPPTFLCGCCESRLPLRIADFLASGVMLCVIVSSRSTAAFVGAAAALLLSVTALLLRKKEAKKLRYALLLILPSAIMLAADPQGTLKSLRTETENSGVYDPSASCLLKNIEIGACDILLECESCSVTITLTGESSAVVTGTNGEFLAALENSGAQLSGEYAPISVSLNERLLVLDLGYKDTIEFETTGGAPIYIGLNGYLEPNPEKSAFPELSEYYRFGTGRGYIWLSSVPLLKGCLFKGYGAGQFPFYFPHSDIVGMLNTHGTTALCIDKPHSMYLGIALAHGIPALLAFVCLAAAALWRGVGKGSRLADNALAISVMCALIMGVANDSCVVYSPLLWIFAGAACSESRGAVSPRS